MNANDSTLGLAAMMRPARTKTGVLKRNARKVEREMLVRAELAFELRDKFPLAMSLLTIIRTVSKLITGL